MANRIITIGRQFGSGGREIGKKISEKLGIGFYDKMLLERAAKDSGMCRELFDLHDEAPTSSFLYSLVTNTNTFGYPAADFSDTPIHHKIFNAQFGTIRQIASEESCVIVGRAADAVLDREPNVLSVFIYADPEYRIERIAKEREVTTSAAKDLMKKNDKQRSAFYNYYTNKKWGDMKGYDLALNSSALGIDGCVDLIVKAYEHKTAK